MQMLIVEDDALHRSFLKSAVLEAMPDGTVVQEAEDGAAALEIAQDKDVEAIILDLQMPKLNGVETAKRIWRRKPETKILFWSNFSAESYVRGVSRIVPEGGVYGYILKSATEELLQLAVQGVFIGGQCVIDRKVRDLQDMAQKSASALTETEIEVLIDLALGLTDKAIAQRRRISLRGVQARLHGLYAKLGLERDDIPNAEWGAAFNPRSRAASIAILRGILTADILSAEETQWVKWLESNT